MKPNFALSLSLDGILLLHLSPRQTWTEVGGVRLDDPNFPESLSFLRRTAVGLAGKRFGTKLILPLSQILYREVSAPGPGETERKAQIMAALDGVTPYEVADLTFDWISLGQTVLVAAVANETLDEAEEFAVKHRFNPISFVGARRDVAGESTGNAAADAWEPFFARTDFSYGFLGPDADVRDIPVPETTPVEAENLFLDEAPNGNGEKSADTGTDTGTNTGAGDLSSPAGGDNIFANTDPGEVGKNLFSDEVTPPPPDKTQKDAEVDLMPAFSSRHHLSPEGPEPATDRPIRRVAPRIALSSDMPSGMATPVAAAPETISVPGGEAPFIETAESDDTVVSASETFEDTALRSRILDGDTLSPSAIHRRIGTVLAPVLTASSAIMDRISRVFRHPGFRRAIGGALTEDNDRSGRKIPRLRVIIPAVAVLVLLGFAGLVYAYYTAGSTVSGNRDIGGTDNSVLTSTTSAARGVRQENRPQPRPSDLASLVRTPAAAPSQASNRAVRRAIRPERRSVFEGGTNPEANLPDTARPVTGLTAKQLADIRAAGLRAPTPEEMAEGSDAGGDGIQTEADILAVYAKTGILEGVRTPPSPPADQVRDDIFVASLDPELAANDAIILPNFNAGVQDDPPRKQLSPLDPNITFKLDANGLVKPSKAGTINPDGILVRQGKPVIIPPTKPKTDQLVPPNPLLAKTPKARPATLKTGADAIFVQGRLTIAQLRKRRAKARPQSVQAEAQSANGQTPTELAVLTSFQPAKRPSDFAKRVEKIKIKLASVAPQRATGAKVANLNLGPRLPTRASVAKRATIKNAINLSRLNLIGVYGTPSRRSALLRLPSGRFVKVKIGDRVDGGKVAAIGMTSLSYVKGGRNRVLKIPN